ncbi:MAG: hypothetical protein RLY43_566 [Bacteroidota bacterium]|jgi:hypothetical protein
MYDEYTKFADEYIFYFQTFSEKIDRILNTYQQDRDQFIFLRNLALFNDTVRIFIEGHQIIVDDLLEKLGASNGQ